MWLRVVIPGLSLGSLDDNQISRDKIVVIGVACAGQLEWQKVADEVKPDATLKETVDNGDSFVVKTSTGDHTFNKKDYMLHRSYWFVKTPIP